MKNSIKFDKCSNLNINTDEVENLLIVITTAGKPLIIGVVYRHPVYKTCAIEHFSNALSSIFHTLNLNEREFYLVGDMNVNLCQDDKSYETSRYVDNLIGCSVKCINDKPTRITPTSKTSNLHYTRRVSPKRVTSCAAHLRGLAPGQHSSE